MLVYSKGFSLSKNLLFTISLAQQHSVNRQTLGLYKGHTVALILPHAILSITFPSGVSQNR